MGIKQRLLRSFFSRRTLRLIEFDLVRARTRRMSRSFDGDASAFKGLHLGCGPRRVDGWLNVDVVGSDFDIDLGNGSLPFPDHSVNAIVSQHTIEHLELRSELLPLLSECCRVLRPGGRAWLSCPDLAKICSSYVNERCESLVDGRQHRHSGDGRGGWSLDKESGLQGTPSSHMVNSVFYQEGEHRNLFDFELLAWLLRLAGFISVELSCEPYFRLAHPEFPSRGDSEQTLYVVAWKD